MKQSHDKYYSQVLPSISRYVVCMIIFTIFNQSGFAYTWTGHGPNGNWSNPANWTSPGFPAPATPGSGDNLIFEGSTNTNTNNDIQYALFPAAFHTPATFGSITFSSRASSFTLSGNALSFSGNITASNATNTMTINNNIYFQNNLKNRKNQLKLILFSINF